MLFSNTGSFNLTCDCVTRVQFKVGISLFTTRGTEGEGLVVIEMSIPSDSLRRCERMSQSAIWSIEWVEISVVCQTKTCNV